jgi:hypothetical protein
MPTLDAATVSGFRAVANDCDVGATDDGGAVPGGSVVTVRATSVKTASVGGGARENVVKVKL